MANRAERRQQGHENAARASYLRAFVKWWRGAGSSIRNGYSASLLFEETVWPRRSPLPHDDVRSLSKRHDGDGARPA